MGPSGPPNPTGGMQSAPPSFLRSNSEVSGARNGSLPSQAGFSSLVSPRTQFNNMNMLGNAADVSSLLNQSFGNGVSGLSRPGAAVGNGMGFNAASSVVPSNLMIPGLSGQHRSVQFSNSPGNQVTAEHQLTQHLNPQNLQHRPQQMQRFSASMNNQQQQQSYSQQQLNGAGVSLLDPAKSEQHVNIDQQGQQLQSCRTLGAVESELHHIQNIRSLPPIKMEPHDSNQSMSLQQQEFLRSKQSSQTAASQINMLNYQKQLQFQQQNQQEQLPKALLQQHNSIQQQNFPRRSPANPLYEPGMCARRLTHYINQQKHRPEDNNIEFWKKFVTEYFAPNAKKRWCVSMYGSGRQATGLFPQDGWHCEICNRRPGRGFEATVEILPRLFKIKYESGTLEERLHVDMPREYQNPSGQIVLDYAKATQESVFEQLHVVREGQLRVVFSPDLKICSWEFCARCHEELIPRRMLIPQVSQLAAAAQRYQASTQNASSGPAVPDLQNSCNMFVSSARQLAKALDVPIVNDLGYTKRYVRCLQISEVVNCMKDLIDYSKESGTGPIDSLAKFSPRTNTSSEHHGQPQQSDEHLPQQQPQQVGEKLKNDQSSLAQFPNCNNVTGMDTASISSSSIVGLLHQNTSNQQTHMNNSSSTYGGTGMHIPSPGPSSSMSQMEAIRNTFESSTPSSSTNPPQQPSQNGLMNGNHTTKSNPPANMSMPQSRLSREVDPSDPESSVQKLINNMMSSHCNGTSGSVSAVSHGNDVKNTNGISQTSCNAGLNVVNCIGGNGTVNGSAAAGFGAMGGGCVQSAVPNAIRPPSSNNSIMIGTVHMTSAMREQSMNNQHDISDEFLNSLASVNGFDDLQFD